jgi:putative effector of murein hydrolase
MTVNKKDIFKETLVLVLSGLAINFPLNIVILYVLIDVMEIKNTIVLSVVATAIFTAVALARTYTIRYRTETRKLNKVSSNNE